jgi:glucose/mannose-6-phosphate isomerase
MNENAKTQAFWNFFPELNHNEMVGFTNMVMNPFFLIFSSSYSNKRNQKRIEVFCEMMHQKKLDFEVIRFASSNLIEELLAGYYFMDLVSYHLACEYDIDPEPVNMVEDFKKRMEEI